MKRLAALLACLCLVAACRRPPAPPRAPAVPVHALLPVPRAQGPVRFDGHLDEAAWQHAARSGPFKDLRSGALAVPHSEARLMHDGKRLILGLYAADEDIEAHATAADGPVWTDDAFSLRIRKRSGGPTFLIDISAAGIATDARLDADGSVHEDWSSGAEIGVDRDGSVNQPQDDDEEWVVECALPLAALGAAPGDVLQIRIARCDTPHGARQRCAAWGGLRAIEGEVALKP